jgi:CheY-like chemotaxis protein
MTNDRTHVVVIEDAAATRELVQVVVEAADYMVTLARDGGAVGAGLCAGRDGGGCAHAAGG